MHNVTSKIITTAEKFSISITIKKDKTLELLISNNFLSFEFLNLKKYFLNLKKIRKNC